MNRKRQAGDMTLAEFAATFAKPPTIRTLQNWHNRHGRKRLNFFKPGKTPYITATEAERFKLVCTE